MSIRRKRPKISLFTLGPRGRMAVSSGRIRDLSPSDLPSHVRVRCFCGSACRLISPNCEGRYETCFKAADRAIRIHGHRGRPGVGPESFDNRYGRRRNRRRASSGQRRVGGYRNRYSVERCRRGVYHQWNRAGHLLGRVQSPRLRHLHRSGNAGCRSDAVSRCAPRRNGAGRGR